MRFKLIILLSFCLFDQTFEFCIHKDGNFWKLTWASEFDSDTEIDKLYNVTDENEMNTCSGNDAEQQSCNVRENVFTKNGYAFLTTKRKRFNRLNYTGVTMDVKKWLSYGRFEVRAKLPHGNFIQPSIFTLTDGDDQFTIASYLDNDKIARGIHFTKKIGGSYAKQLKQNSHFFSSEAEAAKQVKQNFHIYGLEWSPERARFFFDDDYTPWNNFTESQNVTALHKLRLQVGVGGNEFRQKLPREFKTLDWICPAMVIDYVRIYEQLDGDNQCYDVNVMNKSQILAEKEKINKLCSTFPKIEVFKAIESNFELPSIDTFVSKYQYIIVILVALFAAAVIWMIVLVRRAYDKLERNNSKQQSGNNVDDDVYQSIQDFQQFDDNYEEINNGYYAIQEPNNQSIRQRQIRRPYLPLEDAYDKNEYLKIFVDNNNIPIESNIKLSLPEHPQNDYYTPLNQPNHSQNDYYTPLNKPKNHAKPNDGYDVLVKESSFSKTQNEI